MHENEIDRHRLDSRPGLRGVPLARTTLDLRLPTPAAFRADTAQADLASLADVKWFELFKDERLQDMIRTALVQNFDLRDAVVRVELARANLGITRADQFPTIEASAGITAQRTPAAGRVTRTFGTVAGDLLSFEIDVWGRLRRATEAARADLLASDNFRKAVITTLVSDVATTLDLRFPPRRRFAPTLPQPTSHRSPT